MPDEPVALAEEGREPLLGLGGLLEGEDLGFSPPPPLDAATEVIFY